MIVLILEVVSNMYQPLGAMSSGECENILQGLNSISTNSH